MSNEQMSCYEKLLNDAQKLSSDTSSQNVYETLKPDGDNITAKIEQVEEEVRKLQFNLNLEFRVFERIEQLELTVSRIENEARYNDIHLLRTCSNDYGSVIKYDREVKESTMMSSNEVNKHYALTYSKNTDTFKCSNGFIINSMDAIAGCRNVSSLAYAFYFTHYKLMKPQYADGWLVSLVDTPLLLKDDSPGTTFDFAFTGAMRCYRRDANNGSCIWRSDTSLDPSQFLKFANKYCTHSAITVVLNEGEKVIVDWNIGQFKNLDKGQFVFVIKC